MARDAGSISNLAAAIRRISEAPLQECTGGNEVPEVEAGKPACPATHPLRRDIVPRLADFFYLLGQRQRQLALAPVPMKRPLAKERPPDVLGSINLLGQRARSGVALAHLGCRMAFRGYQCASKLELQV
jgi:hypothetical protein